jgi:hypothetical protein
MQRSGWLFLSYLAAAGVLSVSPAPAFVSPAGQPDEQQPLETRPTRGGPVDGYRWISSLDPAGPPSGWAELAPDPIEFSMAETDQVFSLSLPFVFPFFGQWHPTLEVCSNGWISFYHGNIGYFHNEPVPLAGDLDYAVMVFHDGFGVTPESRILAGPTPSGDAFVIQWDSLTTFDGPGLYTFQAVLHPEGVIDCNYGTLYTGLPEGVDGATVGVEGPGGVQGLQINYNGTGAELADGVSLRIVPEAPPAAVTDLRMIPNPTPFSNLPEYRFDWTPVTTDILGQPLVVDHYDLYFTTGAAYGEFPGTWLPFLSVATPPTGVWGFPLSMAHFRVVAVTDALPAAPVQAAPMQAAPVQAAP